MTRLQDVSEEVLKASYDKVLLCLSFLSIGQNQTCRDHRKLKVFLKAVISFYFCIVLYCDALSTE